MHFLKWSIESTLLAAALGVPHSGPSVEITNIATNLQCVEGSLCFAPEAIDMAGVVTISMQPKTNLISSLLSRNPRLDFIRALKWLRSQGNWPVPNEGSVDSRAVVHSTAIVEPGAVVSKGCQIGPYTVIRSSVHLGCNVKVGASCSLGHEGFGYERDSFGEPWAFPHLGRLLIEEEVVIGNVCSLARGTLADTRVKRGVKIDDGAYIAHNVEVGERTLVMAGVHLNGRVVVGRESWIGTSAVIREGCNLGDGIFVGMGAVVVSDFTSRVTVAGNPAKLIEVSS